MLTVCVEYTKPRFSKNVRFINTYYVKPNPKLDLKQIFRKAFTQAHPDWLIQEIFLKET